MNLANIVLKFVVIIAFITGLSVSAHSPNDNAEGRGLSQQVQESALIVFGQVVDIQYRNSEATKQQPSGIPHTFVTYEVREVLRGEAPSEKITLRIPGGADGRGGIYSVNSAPSFARKQSDVLFIAGGEVQECHLVGCVEGRFRVNEGRVFNAWGVPVVSAKEKLRIGGKARFDLNIMEIPRPSFESVMTNPELREHIEKDEKLRSLSNRELKAIYEKEAPKISTVQFGVETEPARKDQAKEPEAEAIENFDGPMKAQVFFDDIRRMSKQVGEPKSKMVMADFKKRFEIADPRMQNLKVDSSDQAEMIVEERNDKEAKEGIKNENY